MAPDEEILSQIALSHGQARWVLRHFNMSAGDSDASFNALLKSLRLAGLPFAPDEVGRGTGHNVTYQFSHLMELALALAFRTQGVLPRFFVGLIVNNREKLRLFFRRAYLERASGLGARLGLYAGPEFPMGTEVHYDRARSLTNISGTYLHLAIIDSPGGSQIPLEFELIGPEEAVQIFMRGHLNLFPRPPIPLSDVAVEIVRLATSKDLPEIRRGPQ
jgi:hypothetical protein